MSVENGLVPVTPADQRVAEARARLMAARQRTRGTLAVLRRELSERVDWRTWFRDHPELFLGAAFAAGFLLGSRRR